MSGEDFLEEFPTGGGGTADPTLFKVRWTKNNTVKLNYMNARKAGIFLQLKIVELKKELISHSYMPRILHKTSAYFVDYFSIYIEKN